MLLITGRSGFISQALQARCRQEGTPFLCSERRPDAEAMVDLTSATFCWPEGVHTIVHLAGHAAVSDLDRARHDNLHGTLHLFREAQRRGVRRFIFVSSIHALGTRTEGPPFRHDSPPNPDTPYGRIKLETEQSLLAQAREGTTELVIVRPPLVYGEGMKGNLSRLARTLRWLRFTPFGRVRNHRSVVSVRDLASFLILCAHHPRAPETPLLLSEERDLSTRQICDALAGRKLVHLPVPVSWMRATLALLGHADISTKLFDDLQADSSRARGLLGWQPVDRMVAPCPPPRWQRAMDVTLSSLGLVGLSPLLVVLLAATALDTGAPFFAQQRVGRHLRPFTMYKFRTMRRGTAHVPTHLAPEASFTAVGRLLRRTKLDELPQLWNVWRGDMSLVGPRPGLFTQEELTLARQARGVFDVLPGITGWSQTRGIDMSTPELLARTDAEMIEQLSFRTYLEALTRTVNYLLRDLWHLRRRPTPPVPSPPSTPPSDSERS